MLPLASDPDVASPNMKTSFALPGLSGRPGTIQRSVAPTYVAAHLDRRSPSFGDKQRLQRHVLKIPSNVVTFFFSKFKMGPHAFSSESRPPPLVWSRSPERRARPLGTDIKLCGRLARELEARCTEPTAGAGPSRKLASESDSARNFMWV